MAPIHLFKMEDRTGERSVAFQKKHVIFLAPIRNLPKFEKKQQASSQEEKMRN